MNNRRGRLARLQSTSSMSRSRSVTPSSQHRHVQQPAARRAILLGALAGSEMKEAELSPTRQVRAITVDRTPGGSLHAGSNIMLHKSPGGSLRKSPELIRDNVVERIEALDIPEGEIEDVLQRDRGHITRWVPEITEPALQGPSTSGAFPSPNWPDYESDGSGFDSDWDDEFEHSQHYVNLATYTQLTN